MYDFALFIESICTQVEPSQFLKGEKKVKNKI